LRDNENDNDCDNHNDLQTKFLAPCETPPPADAAALRSVHTQSFPPLLRALGASLLVTTYQAGKLVVVRADGEVLNTRFRVFPRPMGLAARADRYAIGTQRSVEEFRNLPAIAAKLDPPGKHDGAFLPRRARTAGDIDVHEMDYAADGRHVAGAARCRVGDVGGWYEATCAASRPAPHQVQSPGSSAAGRAPGASSPRCAKPAESRRSQCVPARRRPILWG
jgi:hypothetical protein